jgi:type II secretory pathway pseudopilin PulG
MKHTTVFPHHVTGFSLVEMAIVLTIVALLLGGLLPTISGQIEQQRRNETRKQLAEIQQALLGFAIMKKRLPCATTETDPANSGYGQEALSCSPSVEGYLPWKTLGVSEMDAWGIKRTSITSPWIGYWRYRTHQNFINAGTPITITTDPSALDALTIVDNNWVSLTSSSERPIAIVFSTGPDLVPNGKNALPFQASAATYQSDAPGTNPDATKFDDILIWISRPLLFNRMVAAGALP